MSSLSELILFFLFFFLILLGEQAELSLDDPKDEGPEITHECLQGLSSCQRSGMSDRVCLQRAQQCMNNISEWTPIIVLSESDGFSFERGEFELNEKFQQALTNSIIPKIQGVLSEKARSITAIEIIGHTDEKPFLHDKDNDNVAEWGNLDDLVIAVLDGTTSVQDLKADDNAGLGLARALSVREFLVQNADLDDTPIHAYSASYTVHRNGTSAGGTLQYGLTSFSTNRRRIEIRIRGPLLDIR